MAYYRFPKNKYIKAIFGLLMLGLLLMTRDSMYSMMVWNFYTCQALSLGIIGVMGAAFLVVNRRNLGKILRDRRMLVLLLATAVMLIPMVVKRDWQLMYFSILLGVYFAVFLSYFITLKELAKWYVVTMSVLGAWSVICSYFLRIFVDNGTFAVPLVTNSIDILFHNFFLAVVPDTFVKNRNFGIFREPGVYQFFLLMGLYLNLYVTEWRDQRYFWAVNGILAVTMVTTFATGGIIELCLLTVIVFFDKGWYADKRARIAALVLVLAVAAFLGGNLALHTGIYYEIRDMVMKFVENPESTGARLGSIAVGVENFFRHPLFGSKVSEVLHAVTDNTSSTLILYDIFGILGGTLNVAAWVALVWKRDRRVWANLALLVVLFLSFNTQNLVWNIFFWLFPMLALVERSVPLLKFNGLTKEA